MNKHAYMCTFYVVIYIQKLCTFVYICIYIYMYVYFKWRTVIFRVNIRASDWG